MKQWPKCGCHMNWKIEYIYGETFMFYECMCGYNTNNKSKEYITDFKTEER